VEEVPPVPELTQWSKARNSKASAWLWVDFPAARCPRRREGKPSAPRLVGSIWASRQRVECLDRNGRRFRALKEFFLGRMCLIPADSGSL